MLFTGGSLDQAMSDIDNHSCIQVIEAVSYFSPQTDNISLISSEPSRVCFCENDTPYCLNFSKTFAVFPGQTLTLHAYVVGQHFGTSKGAVYAQFLEKDTSIGSLERAQKVNQYSCGHESNKLQYLVKPSKANVTRVLVLTAKDVVVDDYYNDNSIEEAIQSYINSGNTTIPVELLEVPVYGIVSIKQCPVGFVFSSTENSCVCMHQLHKLVSKYDVRCYINPVPRVQRKKSLWIHPDPSKNMFSYSEKCLPEYCNASRMEIQVEQGSPDKQCIDNHAGKLCGGCRENFSLAIGSSRCLQECKNSYLSLLLVFAVAGLLLVALIKYLDLTVTQGTLNGLIFYANIIQTSKSAFLEPSSNGSRVFAVIIAWLNLDFGIEVCFIRNLDIYTKTWLQFVFPLYIWMLAVGIIIACRYSLRITRFFGNNAVQVLATLILLSFNKLLRTITVIYTLAEIVQVDTANHRQVTVTVWAHNGHFDLGFVFLAAAATLFVLLWFPFTIFLLLGPCLQRYNHRRGLKWVGKMTPFLDAYYGPFKEKHRHWVGVLLLARVVVIIPAAIRSPNTGGSLLTVAILTAFLLFYTASVGGIYKKNYQSVLEDSFLVNLIMFSALLSHSNKTQYIAAYISFVHVVLVLLAVIIHQVYQRMKCRNEVPCAQVFKWSSISRREYQDIDDGLMSNR